jgi:hypothetical protein
VIDDRATEPLVPAEIASLRLCESARPALVAELVADDAFRPREVAVLRATVSVVAVPELADDCATDPPRPALVAADAVAELAFEMLPGSLEAYWKPAFSRTLTKLFGHEIVPSAAIVPLVPSGY